MRATEENLSALPLPSVSGSHFKLHYAVEQQSDSFQITIHTQLFTEQFTFSQSFVFVLNAHTHIHSKINVLFEFYMYFLIFNWINEVCY